MLQIGARYNYPDNPTDLASGGEKVGGHLEASRPHDSLGQVLASTHTGVLSVIADAALTLVGLLTTDKPRRPTIVIPDRRTRSTQLQYRGRNRGARWARVIGPIYDQPEHLGAMAMVADSSAALNANVITPNVVTAVLAMVADSAIALPGVAVIGIVPGQGLTMQGTANLSAAGTEIFGSGSLTMVGTGDLRMRGTGGNNASIDPLARRGGLVAIGIRGGHS